MATQDTELTGPDLETGLPLDELTDGEPLLGHARGEAVMLVRRGDDVHAIGATCTHYGGPLAEGRVEGDRVFCPWHHACFSLRTGEAVEAPALDPVARWVVEVGDGRARVTGKEEHDPLDDRGRSAAGPASVVIVGAGAAGSAAAEMLRRQGYGGPITLVDPEESAPYDRPNLSKDFLAGSAPEEWIPIRPGGFYEEHGIDRITARAASLDTARRELRLDDGRTLAYDALLLATGARPRGLDVPGADLPHVHTLRSLDDCRRIIAGAKGARRAVVVGSSFIGMETAASLRQRGLEVAIVSMDELPFARTLGEDVGRYLLGAHRSHGVEFHPGRTLAAIEDGRVRLDDGTALDADLVLVGIGVTPETVQRFFDAFNPSFTFTDQKLLHGLLLQAHDAVRFSLHDPVGDLILVGVHAHGSLHGVLPVEVEQVAKVEIRDQITVHHQQRLVLVGQERERPRGAPALLFIEVGDLRVPPRTIPEVRLDHPDGLFNPGKVLPDRVATHEERRPAEVVA